MNLVGLGEEGVETACGRVGTQLTVDSEESTRALCCSEGGWSGDDEGENCEALAVGGGAEGARGFIGVGVGVEYERCKGKGNR
jgi:hypothetical protein